MEQMTPGWQMLVKASGGSTLSKEITGTVISVYLQPESRYPDRKVPEQQRGGSSFLKLVRKIRWEKSKEISSKEDKAKMSRILGFPQSTGI